MTWQYLKTHAHLSVQVLSPKNLDFYLPKDSKHSHLLPLQFCLYHVKQSVAFWALIGFSSVTDHLQKQLKKTKRFFSLCIFSAEIRSQFQVGDVWADFHWTRHSRHRRQGFTEHLWLWPWSFERHSYPSPGSDLIKDWDYLWIVSLEYKKKAQSGPTWLT